MKQIIVEPEFWALFPEAQINLVVVKNIINTIDPRRESYLTDLLAQGKQSGQTFLTEVNFSDNQVIQEWRAAFRKFKTKKGARSSIESLLKRAAQDRVFLPINPLVDIYNSVSLKYAVPAGGEDLLKIDGDLHLGKAHGGENFFPLGAETDAPALPEEIIYYDQTGAVCRCLNWREAQRTMLQEQTQHAVLVIEAINQEQRARAEVASRELKELLDQYFNTNSESYVLTPQYPIATLSV